MTIGQIRQAIKAECKKRGWSERELSRASGVSVAAIEAFLSGRDEISPPVRYKLISVLDLAGRS